MNMLLLLHRNPVSCGIKNSSINSVSNNPGRRNKYCRQWNPWHDEPSAARHMNRRIQLIQQFFSITGTMLQTLHDPIVTQHKTCRKLKLQRRCAIGRTNRQHSSLCDKKCECCFTYVCILYHVCIIMCSLLQYSCFFISCWTGYETSMQTWIFLVIYFDVERQSKRIVLSPKIEVDSRVNYLDHLETRKLGCFFFAWTGPKGEDCDCTVITFYHLFLPLRWCPYKII